MAWSRKIGLKKRTAFIETFRKVRDANIEQQRADRLQTVEGMASLPSPDHEGTGDEVRTPRDEVVQENRAASSSKASGI